MLRYLLAITLSLTLFGQEAYAACDCGSIDSANPCAGQAISVSVAASTPNGGTAVNSEYSWSFNSGGGDARCGQFANGDYWIAPAVGQSTVTITAITSNGTVRADANPTVEVTGLLGGARNYGNYAESENIIPLLPQNYSGIDSLVAAVQRNEGVEGACGTSAITGQCIDSYHVVTVLSAVPENAGSTIIRPNITGTTKELISMSSFDFTKIPSTSFLYGTDAAGLAAIKRRWSHSIEIFALWNSVGTSDGFCSEGGRAFRSHILVDDYAAGTAAKFYNDLMFLFSDDHTISEKKPALAAMLTYGLDLYHAMYDSPTTRWWGSGAGQHLGKFIAPALLAALSTSATYSNIVGAASSHKFDHIMAGPHELEQISELRSGVMVWGDPRYNVTPSNIEKGAYWDSFFKSQCYDGAPGLCNTSFGPKTGRDPYGYIDGPPNKPGAVYTPISYAGQRALVAVMAMMPSVRAVVNDQSLIDYISRMNSNGIQTLPDECVSADTRENPGCIPFDNENCSYYGVTWGPDPANPGECIKTATPPYTQVGRFASKHGTLLEPNGSYASYQVENNWETIWALLGEPPPSTPAPFYRYKTGAGEIFGPAE